MVFNLKCIISISVMKGEEQNFKEMIESECKMMFRLMTQENKMNFESLQGCVFNQNLKEANLSQMGEFFTEIEKKSQEMLQVRCWKWHPYNIWEIKERRNKCVSSKVRHPVTATYILKGCMYSPSNSFLRIYCKWTYVHIKRHMDKRTL